MKIKKKKFLVRMLEIIVIIGIIIITILSINYANKLRGYQTIGGEYLIPIFGLLIILFLEEYLGSEEKKNENKRR